VLSSTHDNYNAIFVAMIANVRVVDENQREDLVKCVERMIDVVKLKGMAARKPILKRLSLESNLMKIIRIKCLETLEMCDK